MPFAMQLRIADLQSQEQIERAAAKVGAANITGQAMYDALLAGPFPAENFMGLLTAVKFDRSAPFPTEKLAVKALTVKDGKFVPLTVDWMAVPELSKW